MSAANAAAIRRRAAAPPNNIQVGQNPTSLRNGMTNVGSTQPTPNSLPPSQRGLTIQQVIANFDTRIKKIEEKEQNTMVPPIPETNISQEIIDEYNSRFEILANEIAELKNLLLKLQSFTMDVNKSLHDDRIRVLSDLETNDVIEKSVTFDMEETLDNKNEETIENTDENITTEDTTSE